LKLIKKEREEAMKISQKKEERSWRRKKGKGGELQLVIK
jgi:hypothetical protein